MKARLPKGYGGKGSGNMQQLAMQAQKIQEDMKVATEELEQKEYKASSGGGAVEATVTGNMEITSIKINPEVVDPEEVDMLSDLIIAAVNESIRSAVKEKDEVMENLSGGLKLPGMF